MTRPEQWGFPGYLTADQQKALEELKATMLKEKMVAPQSSVFTHEMGDAHLLRFLRARDFDLAKTKAMIQGDLEWRRLFEGVVFKPTDFPNVMKFANTGCLYRSGYDKEGRPVLVTKIALLYPREITDMQELVNFWVCYVNELSRECDEQGATDFTAVADLAGFSPSKNFSLAHVRVLVDLLQRFHPERLAYALVLNAPAMFRMVWNLIAPLLEERTKAKVHILGSNPKVLQEYIDPSQLEAFLGGTHEPYALPDQYVQKLIKENVTVRTGLFDGMAGAEDAAAGDDAAAAAAAAAGDEAGKKKGLLARSMSSKRVNQVRKVLARFDTMGRSKGAPKTAEIPKPSSRVTVFGATGRTGLMVVDKCLKAGWDVCAFVRSEGKGAPPALLKAQQQFGQDKLQIVVGNVHDPLDLDRAIETSDVVVSCMGTEKSLSQSADWYTETAQKIVDAMERNGTKRLVVVTAAQAKRMSKAMYDTEGSVAQNASRALYWQSHFQFIGAAEKLIESKGKDVVDFTFVRPAQLDDASTSDKYVVEDDAFFVNGAALPRSALAEFIVKECVVSNKHSCKGVALAGA